MLGRESPAKSQAVESFTARIRERSPWALGAILLGIFAVFDAWTLVLGVIAGGCAIFTGIMGLRDIKERPQLRGRRLCKAGIALGCLGLILSAIMALVVYPMLEASKQS